MYTGTVYLTVERGFRVRAFQAALDTLALPDGAGSVEPVGFTPGRRPERPIALTFHDCDATVTEQALLAYAAGLPGVTADAELVELARRFVVYARSHIELSADTFSDALAGEDLPSGEYVICPDGQLELARQVTVHSGGRITVDGDTDW